MHRSIFVIGISGVSNGGKTTVAKKLTSAFPGSKYFCQDHYFVEDGSDKLTIDPEFNHANWDCLDALNMEDMWIDLKRHIQEKHNYLQKNPSRSPHYVFVEGFTLFNYRPFLNIWTKQYFITLEKEEAQKRRSTRIYEPADCPGYFDNFVWPMYEKHRQEMETQKDIVYLDGTQSPEEIYNKLLKDLTATCHRTDA